MLLLNFPLEFEFGFELGFDLLSRLPFNVPSENKYRNNITGFSRNNDIKYESTYRERLNMQQMREVRRPRETKEKYFKYTEQRNNDNEKHNDKC